MTGYLDETTHDKTKELLLGRKIVSVSIAKEKDKYAYDPYPVGTATLDDGTVLKLLGNLGGCSCSAGDYFLTELNTVDNIITNVEFVDSPEGDDIEGEGHYKIFVFADNQRINFATFEGSDGNGDYGTGYQITIHKPTKERY